MKSYTRRHIPPLFPIYSVPIFPILYTPFLLSHWRLTNLIIFLVYHVCVCMCTLQKWTDTCISCLHEGQQTVGTVLHFVSFHIVTFYCGSPSLSSPSSPDRSSPLTTSQHPPAPTEFTLLLQTSFSPCITSSRKFSLIPLTIVNPLLYHNSFVYSTYHNDRFRFICVNILLESISCKYHVVGTIVLFHSLLYPLTQPGAWHLICVC